ncbi:MAG: undecaprenyl diphosphate synthase family protein, partial [Leptospiraceae bacterium]|nr:undecaprenyl diphosphate synthase family protein [Leptospiraceae bacterium]
PDEEEMRTLLYGSDLPDVDLMIRTGGDRRISNFLLYQLAYAELRFLSVAWPDFGESELMATISDFAKTERRIGGLAAIP